MPSAWEIKEANQILIGILHVDVTTYAWAAGYRNLIIPGKEEHRLHYPFLPLAGMPFDHARNVAAQEALNRGVEYIGFLDSDVVPQRDAFVRLLAHKKPVISGMYCRRSPPASVPVMIKDGQWVTDFQLGSIVEVDLVGSGLWVIHRSVLEQTLKYGRPGKPWFDWRVDLRGLGLFPDDECLSEDFSFCTAIRKAGFKVLVDTSIRSRHVGYGESDFGTFKPLESTPIT